MISSGDEGIHIQFRLPFSSNVIVSWALSALASLIADSRGLSIDVRLCSSVGSHVAPSRSFALFAEDDVLSIMGIEP